MQRRLHGLLSGAARLDRRPGRVRRHDLLRGLGARPARATPPRRCAGWRLHRHRPQRGRLRSSGPRIRATPPSPIAVCSTSTDPTGVGAAVPSAVFPGDSTLLTVAVTPGAGPTSTGLAVTADLSSIGGSASQTFFDDATNGDVAAGDDTFSFQATVSISTTAGTKSAAGHHHRRARGAPAGATISAHRPTSDRADPRHPRGRPHLAVRHGAAVSTQGVVTTVSTNGFWFQDPTPDANDATSEGLFVFTCTAPPAVGDAVTVTGTVSEFRPGGAATQPHHHRAGLPGVTVLSSGNPLPAPVVSAPAAGSRRPR